jgi:hypothetical protein
MEHVDDSLLEGGTVRIVRQANNVDQPNRVERLG